jgi:hypothetical protein
MNQFQTAIAVMAACDVGGPRGAEGRRRTYTAAELDAFADVHWPWSGIVGRFAARLAAIRPSTFRQASDPGELVALPAADATAPA